jgi:hypothetical protein
MSEFQEENARSEGIKQWTMSRSRVRITEMPLCVWQVWTRITWLTFLECWNECFRKGNLQHFFIAYCKSAFSDLTARFLIQKTFFKLLFTICFFLWVSKFRVDTLLRGWKQNIVQKTIEIIIKKFIFQRVCWTIFCFVFPGGSSTMTGLLICQGLYEIRYRLIDLSKNKLSVVSSNCS